MNTPRTRVTFVHTCAILAVIALLTAHASTAYARGGRPSGSGSGRPSTDTLFERFDKNKDGALTKDEVPGRMWDRLAAADANGDGSVTRAEFEAHTNSGKK